ncbi:hypothetical protein [Microbacterium sp. p3-SID336]|uniref:hypothetical protein n=1 Tax=Microbacterium sp. p3-SID336 TaxID=2916212 RepID=UPI0021A64034|nr:hypothetical protein [Microbacterium sp. p3-SID336]MCT1477594.1 hypothetical protein [Microbacterium sp. p3-SID336]
MDVEALAVTKIQNMIARCPHLKAFISSNDKTPFTDGHVDLYGGFGQNKTDFLGRVPVQVKGRTRSGKLADQLTFGIDRTDLLGFQKESGVLYFYVAVDRQGQRSTPYYAILSPFVIEDYLRSAPEEQTSVAVDFKKFRNNTNEIERILGLALKTRDQNPSLGFDPALFQKMQSITVHTLSDLCFDEPLVLRPRKLDYAVELVTDGGMRVPMGGELHIYPGLYMEQPFDVVLAAGGVSYTRVTRQQLDPKSIVLKLAPGLSLTMTEANEQRLWNFAFSEEGSFADRLKAARFIEGFLDTGGIEVNKKMTPLGVISDSSETDLVELRRQLRLIHMMDELFRHLNIDGSLVDLDAVDDVQIRNIHTLHRALIHGEQVSNPDGEVARGLFSLGRGAVMLIILEGDTPDKWRFVDPFDPQAPHLFRWSADDDATKVFPVTVYDVLEKGELSTILNLRLDSIVRAYDAIVDAERTTNLANHQVLALLRAADSNNQRRSEFLGAADTLNEWVIEHEGELPTHLINRWQIRQRIATLAPADLDAIRELRRSVVRDGGQRAAELEVACALLLGEHSEADYLIARLADDTLNEMKDWPIWTLRSASTSEAVEAARS